MGSEMCIRDRHKADITADYGMKPWEDALDMEKLLEKKDPVCFVQYEGLKNNIGQLYKMTQQMELKNVSVMVIHISQTG